MKAVILAGGLGTRISEETITKPKPMVEIGGKPILWHILKIYSSYGINDFIICLGYKGYIIKEYFSNYLLHNSNVVFDFSSNQTEIIHNTAEPWRITLIDTGEESLTGGRLKRIKNYLGSEDFCFTYGDGVGNVDIKSSITFHKAHGKLATLTATQPPGRFGALNIDGNSIVSFKEKPVDDGGWVNGGFFVLSPKVIDYIDHDQIMWEHEPLESIAEDGQLQAYFHHGFWQPMDTLRDKQLLETLWQSNTAPWKTWS